MLNNDHLVFSQFAENDLLVSFGYLWLLPLESKPPPSKDSWSASPQHHPKSCIPTHVSGQNFGTPQCEALLVWEISKTAVTLNSVLFDLYQLFTWLNSWTIQECSRELRNPFPTLRAAHLFFPSTAGAWEPPAQRTRARFCHPSAEVSGNVLVSPGVPWKIELERKKTSHFYFFTTISGENTTIVGGISSYILPSSPHFNKQSVRGGIGNSFFNLNNMKKHLILPKHRIYVVLKPCVTPLIDNPIYSLSSASLSFCLIPLPGHWKRLGMTSSIGCTYIYI